MEQVEQTFWFALILGAGTIQGLFVAFALLKIKNANRKANRKLSLLVFLLAIGLMGRFAYNSHVWETIPQLFLLEDIALFLYGPVFYMYLQDILHKSPNYSKSSWVHFIPTTLHFAVILWQVMISPDVYLRLVAEFYAPLYNAWYLTEIVALILLTAYLVACLRLVLNHIKQEKNFLSFDSKSIYLAVMIGIICIGTSMWWHNYFRFLSDMPKLSIWLGFDAAWCTITLLHFFLGYLAITHQEFFQKSRVNPTTALNPKPLESIKDVQLEQCLKELMRNEQPYLKPDLSLFDLALMIDKPPHAISRTINSRFGLNFFDFINSYRIEEFIKLARSFESQRLTLIALAYNAGFNSKTAFNKAFKKSKGMTPRDFLKEDGSYGKLSVDSSMV